MEDRFVNEVMEKMMYLNEKDRDYLRNALNIALHDFDVVPKKNEVIEFNLDGNYQLLQMYLIAKKVEGCSERTIGYYRYVDNRFLDFVNTSITDIRADHIRYYLSTRSMNEKVSKTTQDNELRCLRSFFGWLTAEEYIQKNPCMKVKAIKKEKRIKKPYTELEIERMRKACGKDKRMLAILDVMYSTGCRVGEIIGMNREDINGDEMIVFGKGAKERTVYLNARAISSLNDYLETRTDINEALFVGKIEPHERLHINAIQRMVRDIGRRVGVKASYPHKMRRTTATVALNRGMPIEEVSQMLGHSEISTTLIYAQASKDTVKADHLKYVI